MVVAEFYDPYEAIDMISVLLSGPWGGFDVQVISPGEIVICL